MALKVKAVERLLISQFYAKIKEVGSRREFGSPFLCDSLK